ncbi:hypothetical protein LR013_04380 [candidate division NPL-UPA2 bacterium]|nr:hypothetical protein [candidate division NPL-UPA2 bacterium]
MRGRWWELRKILSLCEKHSPKDVDHALGRALKYKAFGYKYIEGILRDLGSRRPGGLKQISEILGDLLSKWEIPKVEERPLKTYDQFLNQKEQKDGKG